MVIYDEPKRLANLDKHGLDFADFEAGFFWNDALAIPAKPSRTGRERVQLIGTLNGELVVVAIVSPLGSEAVSLVSLRRAYRNERVLYDQR